MENTKANEKYYRQNGDVVQGSSIPAIKTQQLKDTIRNSRLGTYNAHGRYILSPRVTNEIFGITKYVYKEHFDEVLKESKDVLEFKARASVPVFGQMEFRIVFKNNFAKLYMIENVYREFNGYQEIYGEQITEINCEDDKAGCVDYVFALLNIKVVDEADFGKIPDEDPEKVKAIIFGKLYLTIVAKNYLKESSDDERDTFEDMINTLKDGGEYGKRVLKHFIDRIEKRPDIMQLKDEDGYNEALNDALIGALEVATTEDDMQDPHNKKLYDDLYKKRFKKTEEDLRRAKEDVNEKDFKKVADGVLGKNVSDKLFGDQDELLSLIEEKKEETKQGEQDNQFLEDLENNPVVKRVISKVSGREVGKEKETPETSKEQDAAVAASKATQEETILKTDATIAPDSLVKKEEKVVDKKATEENAVTSKVPGTKITKPTVKKTETTKTVKKAEFKSNSAIPTITTLSNKPAVQEEQKAKIVKANDKFAKKLKLGKIKAKDDDVQGLGIGTITKKDDVVVQRQTDQAYNFDEIISQYGLDLSNLTPSDLAAFAGKLRGSGNFTIAQASNIANIVAEMAGEVMLKSIEQKQAQGYIDLGSVVKTETESSDLSIKGASISKSSSEPKNQGFGQDK